MNEAADVLDTHGLGVQIDHGGCFVLKHGAVKIVAVAGSVVVALGVIEEGGGGLARCSSALEGLALVSSEGVDLLGGIDHPLLNLGSLSKGIIAGGLALLALGLGSLRMLPLLCSGDGILWGEGGPGQRSSAAKGRAGTSGQWKGKNRVRNPDS